MAQDGSGNFTTVSAAVEAAPVESAARFVIYVKKGVYREAVEVGKKKWNLMLVGDGMGATVISGNRSYVDGYTTYRSATVGECGRARPSLFVLPWRSAPNLVKTRPRWSGARQLGCRPSFKQAHENLIADSTS